MRELSASFLVVCLAMSCLWPGQMLSRDAKVSIVISRGASSAERIAAEELSHFLGMMYSDTDFEIVRGKSSDADREILVGCAESFSELQKHVAVKLEEMPESWQKQYVQELVKTPEAAKLWKSHNFFALSKIVAAFERAVREIGRDDVRVAVGSWRFDFLPGCNRFLPRHVKFIPLDWEVLNNRSQLRDEKSMRETAWVAVNRTVLPVVWAHHDDGNYMGRPYTPYSDFHSRLIDSRAPGYSPPNPGAQLSLGASELRTGDSCLEAAYG